MTSNAVTEEVVEDPNAHITELLNELMKCGGSEPQSVIREKIHSAYKRLSDEERTELDGDLANHPALIKGKMTGLPNRDGRPPIKELPLIILGTSVR